MSLLRLIIPGILALLVVLSFLLVPPPILRGVQGGVVVVGKDLERFLRCFLKISESLNRAIHREKVALFMGSAAIARDLILRRVAHHKIDFDVAHLRELDSFLEKESHSFALNINEVLGSLDDGSRFLLSLKHLLESGEGAADICCGARQLLFVAFAMARRVL